MKKRFFFAAVLSAVITLAPSCKKEKVSGPVGPDASRREIVIRPVNVVSTRSAVSSTGFPSKYDMSVSMYRNADVALSEDGSGNYYEGIQFSNDAASLSWKSVSGPKYWPQNGTLDFLAVSCAGLRDESKGIVPEIEWGSADNVAAGAVLTVQDNSEKFDDLLYGSVNGVDALSQDVDIAFHHAFAAVAFTAKCDVAYDSTRNVGVTIDAITVDGASFGGKLTVDNPAAGGGSGELKAVWSDLSDVNQHVAARVWGSANTGDDPAEAALSGLHLGSEACSIATNPFGEAYVLLPEQDAVPFTISYTLHNGFAADGVTPQDNELIYKYYPYGKWESGRKYFYAVTFNLTDVQIRPTVIDWSDVESKDTPVPEKVSATYSFSGVSGNKALPKLALGQDCAVKINWGDGTPIQVYENRSGTKTTLVGDGGVFVPRHFYSGAFTGKVKMYVEGGSVMYVRENDDKLTICDAQKVTMEGDCIMLWSTGAASMEMVSEGEVSKPVLEYSLDAKQWKSWNLASVSFGSGNRIFLRGKNPEGLNKNSNTFWDYNHIVLTGDNIYSEGNANTLLDYENPDTITLAPRRCFYKLFTDNKKLLTPLDLPARKVSERSYAQMYYGNWLLGKAPELPAADLAEYCYERMFTSCRSLAAAPELKATKLYQRCYDSMFLNCYALTKATKLPATSIPEGCYSSLFNGTAITECPALPAKELSACCYAQMFNNCKKITAAPALPADTSIPSEAYSGMFWNCVALKAAPELPATVLESKAYYSMFQGCTSLTSAPAIGALKVGVQSCSGMFLKCTELVSGPVMKADTLASQCYYQMCDGCTKMTSITVLARDFSASQSVKKIVDMNYRPEMQRKFYVTPGTDWSTADISNWTIVDCSE